MDSIFFRKILYAAAIGIGCLVIGFAYGLLARDKVFVILSILVTALCIGKIIELYLIGKNKKYETITGKCIEVTLGFLGRYRNVRIEAQGEIVEISVPKNVKLRIGDIYIFYFKEINSDISGLGKKMKEKVLSDNFIGFEEMKE